MNVALNLKRNVLIIGGNNSPHYTDEEVIELLCNGSITSDTLMWRAEFSTPVPLSQLPEFNFSPPKNEHRDFPKEMVKSDFVTIASPKKETEPLAEKPQVPFKRNKMIGAAVAIVAISTLIIFILASGELFWNERSILGKFMLVISGLATTIGAYVKQSRKAPNNTATTVCHILLGAGLVIGTIVGWDFGIERNPVYMIKNGTFNDMQDVALGDFIDSYFQDVSWHVTGLKNNHERLVEMVGRYNDNFQQHNIKLSFITYPSSGEFNITGVVIDNQDTDFGVFKSMLRQFSGR